MYKKHRDSDPSVRAGKPDRFPVHQNQKTTVVMNNLNLRIKILGAVLSALLPVGMSSCDNWLYEDLDPCTVTYILKFRYDYNMKFADAFSSEVRSVNVWAFDQNGNLVWKGETSGDALGEPDFYMTMDIKPGIYDFVAWCGLTPTSPFRIPEAQSPANPQSLGCEMQLMDGHDGKYINDEMDEGLYHGVLDNVELTTHATQHVVQEVTIPLVKDTKEVQVMLQHIDGTPIGRTDFSVSISGSNSLLDWDNAILPGQEFIYTPWSTIYGSADLDTKSGGTHDAQTSVTTLLCEIATNRMIADREQILTVTRNTDGQDIIKIPILQYLLLVKGNYHRDLSDQEYLDRQDEFSLVFFLTEDNNWYTAGGIYINSWAVLPPQENEF